MNRLAIFDCDGTLVDSGATIYARACGELRGRTGSRCHRRRWRGGSSGSASPRPWPRCCRRLPPSSTSSWPRITSTPSGSFAPRDGSRSPCSTAFWSCSTRWRRDGWLLAVATGKSDRGLKHCLEQPRHPRALRVAADRGPASVQAAPVDGASRRSPTPVPRPKRRFVVGDTSFDMAMAAAAGAAPIGAAWGYHEAEELMEAGAVAVAERAAATCSTWFGSHVDG